MAVVNLVNATILKMQDNRGSMLQKTETWDDGLLIGYAL